MIHIGNYGLKIGLGYSKDSPTKQNGPQLENKGASIMAEAKATWQVMDHLAHYFSIQMKYNAFLGSDPDKDKAWHAGFNYIVPVSPISSNNILFIGFPFAARKMPGPEAKLQIGGGIQLKATPYFEDISFTAWLNGGLSFEVNFISAAFQEGKTRFGVQMRIDEFADQKLFYFGFKILVADNWGFGAETISGGKKGIIPFIEKTYYQKVPTERELSIKKRKYLIIRAKLAIKEAKSLLDKKDKTSRDVERAAKSAKSDIEDLLKEDNLPVNYKNALKTLRNKINNRFKLKKQR